LKKLSQPLKSGLHPRNRHQGRYNFNLLIEANPRLREFVRGNGHGDVSVDFSNPHAVKALNQALLQLYYGLKYWDIPEGYLCPPVPGRADYIHYAADLLAGKNKTEQGNKIPEGAGVNCLDIGSGANCIYEIVGHHEYGWSFTGSDIDPDAIQSANKIIAGNPTLKGSAEFRLQKNQRDIFEGIILPGEIFDLTICNPPFHTSAAAAREGSLRKLRNLKIRTGHKPVLNFGGQSNELWCPGGEVKFIGDMIQQSKDFAKSCFWFTSLAAKSEHLPPIYNTLKATNVIEFRTIEMHQGNKASRFIAWTFLNAEEQESWAEKRWQ
jgi:23S rRNA (adenine1618-N6)-methyltransferase